MSSVLTLFRHRRADVRAQLRHPVVRPLQLGRTSPARLTAASLFAVAALAVVVTTTLGAQADPRQRAMYVSVRDRNGAPVKGLRAADFIVREDGASREVLRAEPATDPLELTIVVDNSGATDPVIADVRRALTGFVTAMAPGNEIGITTCGGNPEVVATYTSNADQLRRAVTRLFPVNGTGSYLLDALSLVAKGIRTREPQRPVVLAVLSAASPEFSGDSPEAVIAALRQSGARLDAIVIQSDAAPPPPGSERALAAHDRDRVLDEASVQTGGVNDQALSSLALGPTLEQLAAALRSEYLVVYARPESLIPPEKIEVAVKTPGLVARGTPVKVNR